jgi:hypothetical protein
VALSRFSAVAAELAKACHDGVVTGTTAERDRARALAELAGLPESSVLPVEPGFWTSPRWWPARAR